MQPGIWFWIAVAVVALIVVLLFRKTGFRIGAEGFGAKVELEGKGEGRPRDEADGSKARAPATKSAEMVARERGIAIGGNASGTFVAGDDNRVDGGRRD